jgi:hypothetical protein
MPIVGIEGCDCVVGHQGDLVHVDALISLDGDGESTGSRRCTSHLSSFSVAVYLLHSPAATSMDPVANTLSELRERRDTFTREGPLTCLAYRETV